MVVAQAEMGHLAHPGASEGTTTPHPVTLYHAAETSNPSVIKWAIAWGVVLVLLLLFNRSKAGHSLIYYGLVLSLLLLVVANYGPISALLAPASGIGGSEPGPTPIPDPGTGGPPEGAQPGVTSDVTRPITGRRAPSFLTSATLSGGSAIYG